MLYESIKKLVQYGIDTGLTPECERIYTTNLLLDVFHEDGKGKTVADFNSFKRSHLQADSKVASDFYHHWNEDIDLMKELGMKTYRFSISWARIIPDGDGSSPPKIFLK